MNGSLSVHGTAYVGGIIGHGADTTNTVTGLTDMRVISTNELNWLGGIDARGGATNNVEMNGFLTVQGSGPAMGITSNGQDSRNIVTGLRDINIVNTKDSLYASAAIVSEGGGENTISMNGSITIQSVGPAVGIVTNDSGTLNGITGLKNVTVISTDNETYGIVSTQGGRPAIDMDGLITAIGAKEAWGLYTEQGGVIQLNGNVKVLASSSRGPAFSIENLGGTINAGTDGQVSLGKTVQLVGTVHAKGYGATVNLALDQPASYLMGKAVAEDNGIINMTLAQGTVWNPAYNSLDQSHVTALVMNGGVIRFGDDADGRFQNLVIDKLSGTGGTVLVQTDLAHNQGDTLTVEAGGMGAPLSIGVVRDAASAALGRENFQTGSYAIITGAPTNMAVEAVSTEQGAFAYSPSIENAGNGIWKLTALATTASRAAKAAEDGRGIVDRAWLQETNSLSKRLGDLHLGQRGDEGIWCRYQRGTMKAGKGREAELDANLFQAGYDKEFSRADGKAYWGLAVDHLNGTSDYEYGSGRTKATSVALYHTWVGREGHYYDVTLRQGHYSNEYSAMNLDGTYSSGDYGINATTLSGEYGYRRVLKNGWYVEPQIEIVTAQLTGGDYETDAGYSVHIDRGQHFISRLGAALGQQSEGQSWYGRFSYFHDFAGGGTYSFDGYEFSRTALRDWVELTLGGDVKLSASCRAYGEVTKYWGDLKNQLNFSAGVRVSF